MKKLLALAGIAALGLAVAPVSAQTVIFEDDFDSYNTDGDVLATAEWEAFAGGGELSTEEAFSGSNSIKAPAAGASSSLAGGHTGVDASTLSETNPLTVTVMYLDVDSTVGAVGGVALRTGLSYGAWPGGFWGAPGGFQDFFSIGPYTPTDAVNYHARVVEGGGWQNLNIERETGWREFKIVITDTDVEFYVDDEFGLVDQFDDGVTEWNGMRLGNFAAAADSQDAYFDNFSVVVGLAATNVDQWHLHTY